VLVVHSACGAAAGTSTGPNWVIQKVCDAGATLPLACSTSTVTVSGCMATVWPSTL
jgi:hypothetical protein